MFLILGLSQLQKRIGRGMSEDYTKHTFLSRVLGHSEAEQPGLFVNDDDTDMQFSTYPLKDRKVKDLLMSDVSLGNPRQPGRDNDNDRSRRKRSNVSINFNSESEDSSDEEEMASHHSGNNINNDYNGSDVDEKHRLREELELELELGGVGNEVPGSLFFDNNRSDKLDHSLFGKIGKSVMDIGETTLKRAKSFTHKTVEKPVLLMNQQPPTFITNMRKHESSSATIQRNVFKARKLPPRERALWMWANVSNLDIFLNNVYEYFLGNGWLCIFVSRCCDLLIIFFVVTLCSCLGNCIDYSMLMNGNVTNLSQVYDGQCYSHISLSQKFFYALLGILFVLRVKNCYSELLDLNEIKLFYNYLLDIDDSELQTITWPQIVKKIMILRNQNTNALINENNNDPDLQSKTKLNPHDIANRLMRKENYMIAIFNKNILDKALTFPFFKFHFLTKTLEWNLKLCIFDYLFNDEGQLEPKVLSQQSRLTLIKNLRKRFRVAGLLSIFLSPFLVIYFILYYFLKLFYDVKTNPGLLNARSYSPYAKWKMREYNELPHLFDQRINMSYEYADEYLNLFPKELLDTIFKFISFITGSLVTILVILTVIDHENFLNFEITEGKTVLFYMSALGAIFTVCKNAISDSSARCLFNPETSIKKVAKYTHYLPASWDNRYHTVEVKKQFSQMYNLKMVLIFKELCSLVALPYMLYISLPQSADKIIDFFRDYSVHVDGIGYVCSFAVFKMEQDKDHISFDMRLDRIFDDDTDDKMIKSYVNFVESYGNGGVNNGSRKIQPTSFEPDVSRKFSNPTQTLLKRNLNGNSSNTVLKPNFVNTVKNRNDGISNLESHIPASIDRKDGTHTGLSEYVNDLSTTMMIGESFHLGYARANGFIPAETIEEASDDEDMGGMGNSGGVLGLLNQVYKHK